VEKSAPKQELPQNIATADLRRVAAKCSAGPTLLRAHPHRNIGLRNILWYPIFDCSSTHHPTFSCLFDNCVPYAQPSPAVWPTIKTHVFVYFAFPTAIWRKRTLRGGRGGDPKRWHDPKHWHVRNVAQLRMSPRTRWERRKGNEERRYDRPRGHTRLSFHAHIANVSMVLAFQHVSVLLILKCHECKPAMRTVTFSHHFDIRNWPKRLCKMGSQLSLIFVSSAANKDLSPAKIAVLIGITVRNSKIFGPS